MSENQVSRRTKEEPRFFYGFVIVAAAFLIMLLAYGVRTSFGVFFKPMQTEFGWTRALTSGAVTLSMLVQGLWGIFMGRVNDRIGSRLVITLCCFLLGAGLILLSTTHYSWQLYLFYGVVVGLGMGGVFVALVSTVTRWFVKKRGMMTGFVLGGIGAGTVTVAPLSNWLISLYGWRTSNIILGCLVLITGIAAAQLLRKDPARMGLAAYGQSPKQTQNQHPSAGGLTLREAAVSRQFWIAILIFACVGYCTFTITIHLVPHITDLGIASAAAAGVLAVTGGMSSVGGVLLGIGADRIGNRKIIAISMVIVSAALLWLVSINAAALFYLFALAYSVGIGGATAMESTLTADLFGLKSHGLILGIMSFGFTIGGAVGPLITGYLFDRTGNYRLAFLICAAAGIVGVILTGLLTPLKKLNQPPG